MKNDLETRWPVEKRAGPGGQSYVFCHGNLHAHSLLMHAETLHVLKIVDWDNAGFFPPDFQVWTVRRPDHDQLFRDKERCKELSRLMM